MKTTSLSLSEITKATVRVTATSFGDVQAATWRGQELLLQIKGGDVLVLQGANIKRLAAPDFFLVFDDASVPLASFAPGLPQPVTMTAPHVPPFEARLQVPVGRLPGGIEAAAGSTAKGRKKGRAADDQPNDEAWADQALVALAQAAADMASRAASAPQPAPSLAMSPVTSDATSEASGKPAGADVATQGPASLAEALSGETANAAVTSPSTTGVVQQAHQGTVPAAPEPSTTGFPWGWPAAVLAAGAVAVSRGHNSSPSAESASVGTVAGVITFGPVIAGNNLRVQVRDAQGLLLGEAAAQPDGRYVVQLTEKPVSSWVRVDVVGVADATPDFIGEDKTLTEFVGTVRAVATFVDGGQTTVNVTHATDLLARQLAATLDVDTPAQQLRDASAAFARKLGVGDGTTPLEHIAPAATVTVGPDGKAADAPSPDLYGQLLKAMFELVKAAQATAADKAQAADLLLDQVSKSNNNDLGQVVLAAKVANHVMHPAPEFAPTVSDYQAAGIHAASRDNLAALNEAATQAVKNGRPLVDAVTRDALANANAAPTAVTLTSALTGSQIAENTPVTTRLKVADIAVTDDGLGSNTFTLDGTDKDSFEVVGNALYLKAGTVLDYEAKSSYAVTVKAQDSSVAGSTPVSANYTLGVTDVADTTPAPSTNAAPTAVTLTSALTGSQIAENTPITTRLKVANIAVTDDGLGSNTFTLDGADQASFELDGNSLYLKAGTVLDYETKTSYAVTVKAQDSTVAGSTPVSASYTLSITDVADTTPAPSTNAAPTAVTLTSAIAGSKIAENTPVTTRLKVADIAVTDDGLGSNTFTLDGADKASFELDGNALYLKSGTVLDYETQRAYVVTVKAQDSTVAGSTHVSASYTLSVTDVDDTTPVPTPNAAPTAVTLTSALTGSHIAENTPVTTRLKVADIAVTDDGLGSNTLTLDGADKASFELDGNALYLKAGTVLDYETQRAYAVTVKAQDSTVAGSTPVSASYMLSVTDVDDTTPVPTPNAAPTAVTLTGAIAESKIAENTPVTTRLKVADIAVTDDGLGSNTFTLDGTDKASFELDGNALYLKSGTVLDYETKTSYAVTVKAQDSSVSGSTHVSASYTLSVTDVDDTTPVPTPNAAPTAVTLTSAIAESKIAENTPVTARLKVADIAVTDDGQGSNTFTLDGTDNASFELDGNALYLKAGTVLDYETKTSYAVTVKAQDSSVSGSTHVSASYTLSVTDMDDTTPVPTPNAAPTAVTLTSAIAESKIAENTPITTRLKVADIAVTDDGQGSNTFTLDGADKTNFDLDGNALYLKAGTVLDYETKTSYAVTVKAQDSTVAGSTPVSASYTLSVTDVDDTTPAPSTNAAPTAVTLTSAIAESKIAENTPVTTRLKVADIAVTDDGLGSNSFTLDGADQASFELDGNSLYLKAGTVLDYETKTSYAVTVKAQDSSVSGSTPVSANYTLGVTDVADTTPAPSANAAPTAVTLISALTGSQIAENTPVTTRLKVADIAVTDDGQGSNTFTLDGADKASFELDGNSLYLKAGTVLDYETKTSYAVTVKAQDSTVAGSTPVSASYTLSITDVADTTPAPSTNAAPTAVTLTSAIAGSKIAENTPITTRLKVADIAVTDDGQGSNTFTLEGADQASFELDGNSLYLKAGTVLDYETKTGYAVTVKAQDSSVAGSTPVSATYTLGVTDFNETPPTIDSAFSTPALSSTNLALNADWKIGTALSLSQVNFGTLKVVARGISSLPSVSPSTAEMSLVQEGDVVGNADGSKSVWLIAHGGKSLGVKLTFSQQADGLHARVEESKVVNGWDPVMQANMSLYDIVGSLLLPAGQTVKGHLDAALVAGAQVQVFDGATPLGYATVAADGVSWRFEDSRSTVNTAAYTAKVVLGSVSGASSNVVEVVYNHAPMTSGVVAPISATKGQAITAIDVASKFTDSDPGDTLTYAVTAGNLPEGLVLGADGQITGTPTLVTSTAEHITVTATDHRGLSATQSFDVSVSDVSTTSIDTSVPTWITASAYRVEAPQAVTLDNPGSYAQGMASLISNDVGSAGMPAPASMASWLGMNSDRTQRLTGASMTAPLQLSYAFQDQVALFRDTSDVEHVTQDGMSYTDTEKAYVRQVFNHFAEVSKVVFTENTSQVYLGADLRLFKGTGDHLGVDRSVMGFATQPTAVDSKVDDAYGNLFLVTDASAYPSAETAFRSEYGSENTTVTHELGHAMGLDHPFQESDLSGKFWYGDGTNTTLNRVGNETGGGYDNPQTDAPQETVMTYLQAFNKVTLRGQPALLESQGYTPWKLGVYDMAALQHLYGANMTTQTGNDTYRYDSDTPVFDTLWDAQGVDTLQQLGSRDAIIDLRGGEHMSRMGLMTGASYTFSESAWEASKLEGMRAAIGRLGISLDQARVSNVRFVYTDATTGDEVDVTSRGHVVSKSESGDTRWTWYDDPTLPAGVMLQIKGDFEFFFEGSYVLGQPDFVCGQVPSGGVPDASMAYNVGIAFGVVIENAVGGGGDDEIWGNLAANTIATGGGKDVVKYDKAAHIDGDTILDFSTDDRLDLSQLGIAPADLHWEPSTHLLSRVTSEPDLAWSLTVRGTFDPAAQVTTQATMQVMG
ncbi:putative Ig domain-containing protein [Leptothrix discophora]|uniref:Ig domain-containing protein n=1 Tax=Leptothrix discophora TaxID=89 RepID=A0ABT9G3E3_LEPDI|nr:putative Ig domain-containing protein [Leptothrix discophora]MDP4300994.1 putative Ig domain-containing protein [Leptothrix discophora]